MIGPSIRLRSEITRDDAQKISGWMSDREAAVYLSDSAGVSAAIDRALARAGLHVVTHLFNQGGRFFIAEDASGPVGFVRLVPEGKDVQIVLLVEKSRWGRKIGGAMLPEALKILFFEMRANRALAVIHRENHRSRRLFLNAGFSVIREGEHFLVSAMTMSEYIRLIQGGRFMKRKSITITSIDRERLNKLLEEAQYGGVEPVSTYRTLKRELEIAEVVEPKKLPSSVVSMRTRALIALDGEEEEISLVYPSEADWQTGKLSILSPVGTALIGYREGDEIDWETSGGKTLIEIRKILYQPEAAGDYEL